MKSGLQRPCKILLVGPYPPPYGGIAMTVFDLRHYLVSKASCEVVVLNIGEGRKGRDSECLDVQGPWDYLRKVVRYARRGYIIHLETNGHNDKSWLTALVCSLAGALNARKTIIAFGSGNLPGYLSQARGWKRWVVMAVLGRAGMVICRNDSMRQSLQSFPVRPRIEVVPGFMGVGGRVSAAAPKEVIEFCESHSPVLGATVTLSSEYGIPLALDALKNLRHRYPHIGMILIGIGPDAEPHLPAFPPLRGHVLLAGALAPDVTISIMKRLTVFVRPTYFDGDSVSVREALALGIPVVASDTGFRPLGVRRFAAGDCTDFCRAVDKTLEEITHTDFHEPDASAKDGNAPVMLALYRQL